MITITTFGPVTRFDLGRSFGGKARYWTTCYLVDGLLLDSGCAHTATELEHTLQGVSLRGILNTHTHEDHIGANGRLQRSRPSLKIQAHPLALPVLADPAGQQPLHFYRRIFWGWPEPSKGEAIEEGQEVRSGTYCFQVFHTPGHAQDHLCFFEPEQGWLFSGDLYVGGRDRALRAGYDIWAIIASLKRIAALPVKILFPAAARVRENPGAEIAAKIDYLEEMGVRTLDLHRQGIPEKQIAHQLFGGRMGIEIFTHGHFTRQNLVRSYLGKNDDW